uniref:Uncharacterized protein n=1 Tax=Lygus hesperus TaxID=30085 RepID=A0A0A9X7L2_LYGHE
MGFFRGLESYSTGVTRMSNVPPRPPDQNQRQSSPPNPSSNSANNSFSSFRNIDPSSSQQTYFISQSGITQGPRHPSHVKRSFPTMSRSGDMVGKRASNTSEEDDDDEEVEIKIAPPVRYWRRLLTPTTRHKS